MEETERLLRGVVADITGRPVDVDSRADLFADFGLTPEEEYFLLVELEDRFHIHIPDEEFIVARSVEKLTALVNLVANRTDTLYEARQRDIASEVARCVLGSRSSDYHRTYDRNRQKVGHQT